MRRTPMSSWAGVAGLSLALAVGMPAGAATVASGGGGALQEPVAQEPFTAFTPEQLDNLLAPIALYADPLLAQVLLAATFPDQIAAAAQYVRANGIDSVDDQPWDVSVKAVAHYPTVLNTMDSRIDWTTSLGQAYAAQSTEVMRAVQRMRQMAQAQGNLVSSPEQEVLADDGYIRIWPANPRLIYVPVYDPAVVFVRPVFVRPGFHAFYSFGLPFPIGAWLIYDWDWPSWRIVYTGWHGGGWIARSRPYVRITNVYVNPGYRRVWFGREVLRRRPDYGRIHFYDPIHPGVRFGDRNRGPGPGYVVPPSRQPVVPDRSRRAVPRDGAPSRDDRGAGDRTGFSRTPTPLPVQTRPSADRPVIERPAVGRPAADRPAGVRRAVERPVDGRRGVGRGGAGEDAVQPSRPVRSESWPRVEHPFQERRAVQRPAVEMPRPVPTQTRPRVDYPIPDRPAARQPAEPPRWTPAERSTGWQGAPRGGVDGRRGGDIGRPSVDRGGRPGGGQAGWSGGRPGGSQPAGERGGDRGARGGPSGQRGARGR